MTEEKKPTPAQIARTRKKFGSTIGEAPKKKEAVKAVDAADDLIDAEWESALDWAKRASDAR